MSNQNSFILVVDDNKENLRVVSNFLKKEGYQIALSLNTENAMTILSENKIDLILLDVMMPGEDGYTFCRRLKQDEELKEIPVVFLTARNDMDDLIEGFKSGGVDYLTKPFRKEELLVRVKNHIDLAIAKRNILEQANLILKINQTRDRMYSVISHDIKSPFANISMMISMIAEGYLEPDSDDFREIIDNLNLSTKETYNLLENLLQWTRTQTGNIECHPEVINVLETVENSLGFVSMNAQSKNISLMTDVQADLEINVDPNMMKSVLRNLVTNAIKFTPEKGEISILGSVEEQSVVLKIKDTGVGMDKERVDTLFEENQFITTSGTNNEKGSGLGLHLVHEFVIRNNGTIQVESEPEKGTTFILSFPRS